MVAASKLYRKGTNNISQSRSAIKSAGRHAENSAGNSQSEFMNAIRIHNYGGPEVLQFEDAPRPQLNKGEVLVRVHAAGVNPLDWKVRSGSLNGFIRHELPLIPGWDVSGVVEKVGAGVFAIQERRRSLRNG